MTEALNAPEVSSAVLISGKPDCFIAGADVKLVNSNNFARNIIIIIYLCFLSWLDSAKSVEEVSSSSYSIWYPFC